MQQIRDTKWNNIEPVAKYGQNDKWSKARRKTKKKKKKYLNIYVNYIYLCLECNQFYCLGIFNLPLWSAWLRFKFHVVFPQFFFFFFFIKQIYIILWDWHGARMFVWTFVFIPREEVRPHLEVASFVYRPNSIHIQCEFNWIAYGFFDISCFINGLMVNFSTGPIVTWIIIMFVINLWLWHLDRHIWAEEATMCALSSVWQLLMANSLI